MVLFDLDPNVVRPGWTPLLITLGLGVIMVLLFRSMRRQFRRIDVSQAQPSVVDPQATEPPGAKTPPPAAAPAEAADRAVRHRTDDPGPRS